MILSEPLPGELQKLVEDAARHPGEEGGHRVGGRGATLRRWVADETHDEGQVEDARELVEVGLRQSLHELVAQVQGGQAPLCVFVRDTADDLL